MVYIIYGTDDYSIHEALACIKKGLGDPEALATNTTRLDGGRLTPAALQASVEAFPFFGDKRLVIVEGLLSRYESKIKSSSTKGSNKNSENDLASFITILGATSPTTITLLIDSELKNTNPILKALSGTAEIKECPPLALSRLPEWIKKRASQIGASISNEAADTLARLVGSNLWILSSELEKLSLFTTGQRIETTDVEALVSASREVGVFELVDAIMGNHSTQALKLLQGFLRDGQAPSYIIFMLARQLRLLVRAKSLLADGCSEQFIQDRVRLYGFALRRTLDQAARFSLTRLRALHHLLLDTDLAIKTSRYNEDLAVSLLVAEACSWEAPRQ